MVPQSVAKTSAIEDCNGKFVSCQWVLVARPKKKQCQGKVFVLSEQTVPTLSSKWDVYLVLIHCHVP